MKIPTTALLGALLVMTSFTALSKPLSEVIVTNFPLDEQGNIRTSVTNEEFNIRVTNFPVDEQGNLRIKLAEKPLQRYKEAVEISVLDWNTRYYASASGPAEFGVSYDRPLDFPFAFSPKIPLYQGNLNITSLWINIIGSTYPPQGGYFAFQTTINNIITLNVNNWLVSYDIPTTISLSLEGHPSLQAIKQGLNTLHLSERNLIGAVALSIHEITVFIEYEYLA